MDRLLRDTFVFLKNSKRCGQKSFRVFSRNRATFLKHPHKVDNDGESGKGNTLDFRKFDGFVWIAVNSRRGPFNIKQEPPCPESA